MLAIASTSPTEALPKAGDSNLVLNTHTHTQIQQPMKSNCNQNQVPNPHTHPYLNDTHAHHSKEIKVSPPSLDGKIAACYHHGNHVPPPLEISPAPEISQLGRRTCAEDPCDSTKEQEKHKAAWASDNAAQAAAHTWDNPTLEILLSGQLFRTPRPGLETHPLPGYSWHKPTLDLPLLGKLAFAPRYGLETHHFLCLEPSHSRVVISPMSEAPARTQDAGDAAFRKAAGKAQHLLSLTFIYGGGFANTISGHKNAPSLRARRPFPYLNWIWCACILALCATVDTFDVTRQGLAMRHSQMRAGHPKAALRRHESLFTLTRIRAAQVLPAVRTVRPPPPRWAPDASIAAHPVAGTPGRACWCTGTACYTVGRLGQVRVPGRFARVHICPPMWRAVCSPPEQPQKAGLPSGLQVWGHESLSATCLGLCCLCPLCMPLLE
jgi:hypothetical protein